MTPTKPWLISSLTAFVATLGISLVILTQNSPPPPHALTTRFLVPPTDLQFFTLGYSEVVGDALWIRVIQDFDYCETKSAEKKSLKRCDKGWVYQMVNSITELAPRFREAYLYGGLMLSVIVDDKRGATEIFDKGVTRFPDDWIMLYRAAYHSLSEENDERKAARQLVLAGQKGAPQWVFSLSARLSQKIGQLDFAKSIMIDALENAKDEINANYFRKRLAEIDAQIAEEQAKQKH